MKERMCMSKKSILILLSALLIFLLVVLWQLIMQSRLTKTSGAANTNKAAQNTLIPVNPPTLDQQTPLNIYKVSLDHSGYIELLGTPPMVENGKVYSIYLKRNGSFVHIDSFTATNDTISQKFSYWEPKVKITANDIQNGTFYFFQTN